MTRRDIFVRNLKLIMETRDVKSARELAFYIDAPLTSVGSWLRRGSVPREDHMSRLCKFFKIAEHELFDENFSIDKYMNNLGFWRMAGVDGKLRWQARPMLMSDIIKNKRISETESDYCSDLETEIVKAMSAFTDDEKRRVLREAQLIAAEKRILELGRDHRQDNTIHESKKKKANG